MDISKRPEVVDEKSRVGAWEVDTVIGAGRKGVLVTAVDRRSKFTLIEAVPRKTKDIAGGAMVAMGEALKDVVLPVTDDSGRESAGDREVAEVLGTAVYFARPYRSWERGLNEHTDGLARQYFGKSGSLLGLDPALTVADLLNGRPCKALGFSAPSEVLAETRAACCPPGATEGLGAPLTGPFRVRLCRCAPKLPCRQC